MYSQFYDLSTTLCSSRWSIIICIYIYVFCHCTSFPSINVHNMSAVSTGEKSLGSMRKSLKDCWEGISYSRKRYVKIGKFNSSYQMRTSALHKCEIQFKPLQRTLQISMKMRRRPRMKIFTYHLA
jgi:hypothetical protein